MWNWLNPIKMEPPNNSYLAYGRAKLHKKLSRSLKNSMVKLLLPSATPPLAPEPFELRLLINQVDNRIS